MMLSNALALIRLFMMTSTDNLIRVRCVRLYFYHSGELFITSLGVHFVEACTRPTVRQTLV
jgi:hypothetical protein